MWIVVCLRPISLCLFVCALCCLFRSVDQDKKPRRGGKKNESNQEPMQAEDPQDTLKAFMHGLVRDIGGAAEMRLRLNKVDFAEKLLERINSQVQVLEVHYEALQQILDSDLKQEDMEAAIANTKRDVESYRSLQNTAVAMIASQRPKKKPRKQEQK